MIDLESLTLSNFMSWGDYETTLEFSTLQQCFISGIISGEHSEQYDRSNGAGKSSLTQALLWCLSGRTMYNSNPGDKVLNKFTKKDCSVSLKLRNGDIITRTRTTQGKTELFYQKAGRSIIDCTLSTTSNQQAVLNNHLGFDYEIFCGSVFFSQYKKSWMEMTDQARKKLLERIMGIDKLNVYAEVTKTKKDRAEQDQLQFKSQIENATRALDKLKQQQETIQNSIAGFETSRTARYQSKLAQIATIEQQLEALPVVDIEKLQSKWDLVAQVEGKIATFEAEIREIDQEIKARKLKHQQQLVEIRQKIQDVSTKAVALAAERRKKYETVVSGIFNQRRDLIFKRDSLSRANDDLQGKIQLWEDRAGKICSECEQVVEHTHIDNQIAPQREKLASNKKTIESLDSQIATLDAELESAKSNFEAQETKAKKISAEVIAKLQTSELVEEDISDLQDKRSVAESNAEKIRANLNKCRPTQTVAQAKQHNIQVQSIGRHLATLKDESLAILSEVNPHQSLVTDCGTRVEELQQEIAKAQQQMDGSGVLVKHLHYIHKAYTDRSKIKSFLTTEHVNLLNTRLDHYLDALGLDIKLEITESLGLESNLWGYDFQSGGERKRTDLAFMLAVFDLHEAVYGKQCNILILDEPDSGLDGAGLMALTSIIQDNLAQRFETILVISHRDALKDVFPQQLLVERIDRLSYLVENR